MGCAKKEYAKKEIRIYVDFLGFVFYFMEDLLRIFDKNIFKGWKVLIIFKTSFLINNFHLTTRTHQQTDTWCGKRVRKSYSLTNCRLYLSTMQSMFPARRVQK
jgi:hypothetical protein